MRLIASLSLVVCLCGCRKQPGPSLSETLVWMDQSYNPHEGVGNGRGKEVVYIHKNGELAVEFASNETFTYDRCKMTLQVKDVPSEFHSETYLSHSDSFNLRDIDPHAVRVESFDSVGGENCDDPERVRLFKMNCDAAIITFRTHNDLPSIDVESDTIYANLQGADHDSKGKTKDKRAYFVVDDAAYAERFAKAFQHAIDLCGGKPSAF